MMTSNLIDTRYMTSVAEVEVTYGCGVSDAGVRAAKNGRVTALVSGIKGARFTNSAGALEGTAMLIITIPATKRTAERLERFDVRVECYDGGFGGVWHATGRVSDGGPFAGTFV